MFVKIHTSKTHTLKVLLLITFLATIFSLANAQKQSQPVSLIFDSDIGPDYDDVGAMAVMHALADSDKVNILATVASNKSKYIAATLNVINTYFGRPDIPVGVVKGNGVNLTAFQKWDSLIVSNYPHTIKSNDEALDALELYRSILAMQPDNSVTIVTVGFLTNMANLLQSKADKYSPFDGAALVKKKVKHLVCMAGRFPQGKEFNVDQDAASSKIVFDNWPTQIIFSGFEIGQAIHTGLPIVNNAAITNSPVKDVFTRAIPMAAEDSLGRMSWDETAVLVAINGYEPYYDLVEGKFICHDDGSNSWDANGKNYFYLKEKLAPAKMEEILNALIMHQPAKK